MKNIKNALAVIFMLCLLFSLAACSNQNKPTTSPGASATAQASVSAPNSTKSTTDNPSENATSQPQTTHGTTTAPQGTDDANTDELETNYNNAKQLINDGKYMDAYLALQECRNYKDTEELLDKFTVEYSELSDTVYKISKDTGELYKTKNSKSKYIFSQGGVRLHSILIHSYSYDLDGIILQKNKSALDDRGNIIVTTTYDQDGNIKKNKEYEYDDKNNLTLKTYYENGKIIERHEYEYDDKLNKTLYRYTSNNTNPKYTTEYTYEYEHHITGIKTHYRVITSDASEKNYKYENQFDDRGNLILSTIYDPDGKVYLISEQEFEYDENDNKTKYIYTVYDSSNNITQQEEYNYQYDKRGNMIVCDYIDTDKNGKITYKSKIEYEYDDNDYMIKATKISYDGNDNITATQEYGYENDENGFRTTSFSITYDKDGNMISKTEFTYGDAVVFYNEKN